MLSFLCSKCIAFTLASIPDILHRDTKSLVKCLCRFRLGSCRDLYRSPVNCLSRPGGYD